MKKLVLLFFALVFLLFLFPFAEAQQTGYTVPTTGFGLTINIGAGTMSFSDGSFVASPSTNVPLTDEKTNYIWVDTAGTLQHNTSGFPVGAYPICKAVTHAGQVTSVTDLRSNVFFPTVIGGSLSGTGTTNYIADWTNSTTLQGDSTLQKVGGTSWQFGLPISFSGIANSTPIFSGIPSGAVQVSNLNAQYLGGATFASPGAIGGTSPSTGAFTGITASGTIRGVKSLAPIANDSGTGTTTNELVVLNASGNAVIASSGASTGVLGVCHATCGTTGSAEVVDTGIHSLDFDSSASIVVGDLVAVSSTTSGKGADIGASCTGTAQVIGIATTAGSGGTTQSVLFKPGLCGAGGSGTVGGSGTQNYVARWSSSSAITGDSTLQNISTSWQFGLPISFTGVSAGTPVISGIANNAAVVTNLNANFLNGATFASPGAIGSVTPSTGAFTHITGQDISLSGSGFIRGTSSLPLVNNDGSTGTTANKLVSLNSSGNAIITTAAAQTGVLGVCGTEGGQTCGTSGQAEVVYMGLHSLVFDSSAPIVIGDLVAVSSTTNGDGADIGATCGGSAQVVGIATTAGSAGTTQTVLFEPGLCTAVGSGGITSGTKGLGLVASGSAAGISTKAYIYATQLSGSDICAKIASGWTLAATLFGNKGAIVVDDEPGAHACSAANAQAMLSGCYAGFVYFPVPTKIAVGWQAGVPAISTTQVRCGGLKGYTGRGDPSTSAPGVIFAPCTALNQPFSAGTTVDGSACAAPTGGDNNGNWLNQGSRGGVRYWPITSTTVSGNYMQIAFTCSTLCPTAGELIQIKYSGTADNNDAYRVCGKTAPGTIELDANCTADPIAGTIYVLNPGGTSCSSSCGELYAGTPLIRMGTQTAPNLNFGFRVENIGIELLNFDGAIGIMNQNAQEQSGVEHVKVTGWVFNAIQSWTIQSQFMQGFKDMEIYQSQNADPGTCGSAGTGKCCVGSTVPIFLGDGRGNLGVDRVSIAADNCDDSSNFVKGLRPNYGILVDGGMFQINRSHCEGCYTEVEIGKDVYAQNIEVDQWSSSVSNQSNIAVEISSNFSPVGKTSECSGCTNTVHLQAIAGASSGGNITTSIYDHIMNPNTQIQDAVVGEYTWECHVSNSTTFCNVSTTSPRVTQLFTGGANIVRPTIAKTTNYSVLLTDSYDFLTNSGASGEVDFTLPTCSPTTKGMNYTFYIDNAQTVKAIASGSAKIRNAATLGAGNGNITAATTGNAVKLHCIGTSGADAVGEWIVESIIGSWTVN